MEHLGFLLKDNLSNEVLTDIRALADQFLIAFPNINNMLHYIVKNNLGNIFVVRSNTMLRTC